MFAAKFTTDLISCSIFITLKKDWETFYGKEFINQTDQLYYVGNDIEHRYYSLGNIYVKNSLFESLKTLTNGGGICCESIPKFLAEDTQFVSCTTTASGGAIHFNYSNIVLHKVCGFDCRTQGNGKDNDGPFANTYVTKDAESNNFIIESQISHCTNPSYGYTVSMHYGNISYQYANESRNSCSQCSVFLLKSDDTDGTASYSSFCNNKATYAYSFFSSGSSSIYLTNCNIISNYAKLKLFSNEASKFIIKASCILENECPSEFFGSNFHVNPESKYEIIDCTLDCQNKISGDNFLYSKDLMQQ